MLGRMIHGGVLAAAVFAAVTMLMADDARAAGRGQPTDWQRFYYYPYIYYRGREEDPWDFRNPRDLNCGHA